MPVWHVDHDMKVWASMQSWTEGDKKTEGGEEMRRAGYMELAGMETLPRSTFQTTPFSMPLSASPLLWAVGGQGQGSLGSVTCSN